MEVSRSENIVSMAYLCELGSGHNIYLDHQGGQTIITSTIGAPGQQQQSSSSVGTGGWTAPPEMFRTPQGAILKITTAQGEHFIQVQGSSMSSMTSAPSLSGAQQMQMNQVAGAPGGSSMPGMEPMQPISPMGSMQPMQPMKMGNMEMGGSPMEMRMGNMHLSMGSPKVEPSQPKVRRFCSQCGVATQPDDRFCSSCGHKLA
jgi:zinc-ribbon domain